MLDSPSVIQRYFPIVVAFAFKLTQWTRKDMLSVDEKQSMILQISLRFGFVPEERHNPNYAYKYTYFNA